jgi:hypothetical protein
MRSIQLPPPPSAAERNGHLTHHASSHMLQAGGIGGHNFAGQGGAGNGGGGGGPEELIGLAPISMGLGLGSGMRGGDARERSETTPNQIPVVQVNTSGHPRERSSVSAYERSDGASDGSISKAKSSKYLPPLPIGLPYFAHFALTTSDYADTS